MSNHKSSVISNFLHLNVLTDALVDRAGISVKEFVKYELKINQTFTKPVYDGTEYVFCRVIKYIVLHIYIISCTCFENSKGPMHRNLRACMKKGIND